MSRGFVKEDDQEDVPMVPQRAFLPPGVANFVTQDGLDQLNKEKEKLLLERDSIDIDNESEKRIARNFINAKLQLLNDRIGSARVVENDGRTDEITFGARVTLFNNNTGKTQSFRTVGVDEADIARGKISFISPLAKALMNKKAGDSVVLKRDRDDIVFEIIEVNYR